MTASSANPLHALDPEASGNGIAFGISSDDASTQGDTTRVLEADSGAILAHREQHLVAAAQQQDHDAYRQLVELHQDKIFHFCRQLLPRREDTHEACQDTFIRAYHGLPGFQWHRKTQFSTWLFRIALNLCRDRLRSTSHRRQQLTDPIDDAARTALTPACPLRQPDQNLAAREDLQKLREGIDALPLRLREALILSTLDDLSHRQCGMILRCSERAVEGRVHRARRQLIDWWNGQP